MNCMIFWGRLILGCSLAAIWLAACPACRHSTVAAGQSAGPRIVSIVPAATSILLQIGAAKLLVGVSSYDRPLLPPALRRLPVVGNYLHIDYETLLRLHPTALVIQRSRLRIPPRLIVLARQHHIGILNINLNTLRGLYRTARMLGKAAGRLPTAQRRVHRLQRNLRRISRRYARGPHPAVALLIGTSPIRIVGTDTFLNQMIALAGGMNAAAKVGTGYPAIDRGTLVRLAPRILLIAAPGQPRQDGPNDPRLAAWRRLPIPAAVHHRIFLITAANFEMLSLAADRQVRLLARLIHGEAAASAEAGEKP